jgi:RNA 2',3'-cyclic 3'-phosphodiesterase
VRCFIALRLPEEAGRALGNAASAYREELSQSFATLGERQARPRISWTNAGAYHLTLAFLGEMEGASLEAAGACLEAARGFGDIDFRFAGFGGFPGLGSWRVLFARLEDGGRSAGLFRLVNEALVREAGRAGLGPLNPEWPGAKPFVPHVTLARAGTGRVKAAEPGAALRSSLEGAWTIDRCALYKSELQRSGAVYTELRGIDLSGNSS